MDKPTEFLIITLALLALSGVVGVLATKNSKYHTATKGAILATLFLQVDIVIMKLLLLPTEPVFELSDILWCISIFLFVFYGTHNLQAISKARRKENK